MSTASSQLLVAASAFAQDFYKTLIRKDADQTELVWISRASVLIIASIAVYLGFNPDSFILDMVAYAWAGFGAAFGPAILMQDDAQRNYCGHNRRRQYGSYLETI